MWLILGLCCGAILMWLYVWFKQGHHWMVILRILRVDMSNPRKSLPKGYSFDDQFDPIKREEIKRQKSGLVVGSID